MPYTTRLTLSSSVEGTQTPPVRATKKESAGLEPVPTDKPKLDVVRPAKLPESLRYYFYLAARGVAGSTGRARVCRAT